MESSSSPVEALLSAHAFNDALRTVEAAWTSSADSFVLRARALGGLGRFEDAISELEKVVSATNLSSVVRADALVRAQGYRARVSNDTTTMLRELGRALAMVGEGGIGSDWVPARERAPEAADVAGRAHLESATLFARKRAKKLAEEALERARPPWATLPSCTEGRPPSPCTSTVASRRGRSTTRRARPAGNASAGWAWPASPCCSATSRRATRCSTTSPGAATISIRGSSRWSYSARSSAGARWRACSAT